MSNILSDNLRFHYDKTFATVRGILETFPDDKWLEPHGDDYYIPSRIAYHLVGFIDGVVGGGFKDPDFREKAPFGPWHTGTAETLPSRTALISYFNEVVERATAELEAIDDESLAAPLPEEMARMGPILMSTHIVSMREISAHTGELNKMLIENGKDDVWVAR